MSLRCEFLDDERTELDGHGDTDIEDGLPIFEDATVIGTFTKGYIESEQTEDGERFFCIGEGEIDAMCYNNLCKKLDKNIAEGNAPNGSVEIYRTEDNNGIVYLYGYKPKGRIPSEFIFSGYALLGVRPADSEARLLELNNKTVKEETHKMNENEIKQLISQVVAEMNAYQKKVDEANAAYEKKEKECNEAVAAISYEKEEAIADSEKIKAALEAAQTELQEKYKEIEELYAELERLRKELGIAKANERINEMNSAIANFSDDEKAYAKAELDAFNENPMTVEINSVVSKIYEGIGKKAKEDAATIISEINSADVDDIFGGIEAHEPAGEDVSIF